MLRIILVLLSLSSTQFIYAKNIQIKTLIDMKAINCDALFQNPESKIVPLLNDFGGNGQKNIRLNNIKQTMKIGQNTYYGVQGYQYYKTKKWNKKI